VRVLFVGLTLAVLSGCASYSQSFQKVELLLSQQKPQEALLEVEKRADSGKNQLLYLLDKAMLQRMSGLFVESNATFEQAKILIEELRAVSLVEQAGALTINDSMMSYEGEDYEQIAVHIYAALNYIELGLWDEARVEALQVDVLQKKIAEDNDGVSIEDAFSRYLTGLIYEQGSEWSDAMIAYREAYRLYQKNKQVVPIFLKHDLLRLSRYLGLDHEYKQYQKSFELKKTLSLRKLKRQGEVVVLLHHSLAPIKRAENVFVMGESGVQHRVSLPAYYSRPSYVSHAQLWVGKTSIDMVVADDFDMLARKSLESHKGAMIARLITRAILKKNISNQVSDNNGSLAGFLVDVASMATETADTRSWLTLPKNILFARLPLQSGTYPAKLILFGDQGQVLETMPLADVEVKRGKKTMLERTYVRPYVSEKKE